MLFVFLLLLVMGSFACLQSLVTTLRKREFKFLAQMVVIEILVMFFETMFLYRQFIDTLTPWVAQETGVVLGFRATMSLAAFGWLGTRAMTWFLFAQYGTGPLLALIARRPLADVEAPELFASVPAWRRRCGGGARSTISSGSWSGCTPRAISSSSTWPCRLCS